MPDTGWNKDIFPTIIKDEMFDTEECKEYTYIKDKIINGICDSEYINYPTCEEMKYLKTPYHEIENIKLQHRSIRTKFYIGNIGKDLVFIKMPVHQDRISEMIKNVKIIKHIGNHKNLSKMYGLMLQNELVVAEIYEFCGVNNLREQCEKLSIESKALYCSQIKEIMLYMHEKGVVIGDIKAENFVAAKNEIKLVDFDSCDFIESLNRYDRERQGSYEWDHPERQKDPSLIGTKYDIYNLAQTFLEVFTNTNPI